MKIPVVLVTGFLGSGKTTFLKQIAEKHREWKLVFLVNEFADFSLDDTTLSSTGIPTQRVVGGSLFCECKSADFIRIMRDTVVGFDRKQRLDAVVIETSGIANPDAIGCLMHDHHLSDFFEIHRIVTIVAPGRFVKLIENLPVIETQIKTSDLVILNKVDLSEESQIQMVHDHIRRINPEAEIQRSSFCDCHFDLAHRLMALPSESLGTCRSNPFTTRVLDVPSGQAYDKLRWIQSLPDIVLRAKGHISTSQGWFWLEKTVDSLTFETCDAQSESKLVLIVRDEHADQLDQLISQLQFTSIGC